MQDQQPRENSKFSSIRNFITMMYPRPLLFILIVLYFAFCFYKAWPQMGFSLFGKTLKKPRVENKNVSATGNLFTFTC